MNVEIKFTISFYDLHFLVNVISAFQLCWWGQQSFEGLFLFYSVLSFREANGCLYGDSIRPPKID